MLDWKEHFVHHCYYCQRDVVSRSVCFSCAEKLEREVKEFQGVYDDYFCMTLPEMWCDGVEASRN